MWARSWLSLLQRGKLGVTLLTHRGYRTMGYRPGQDTGATALPPGFFRFLCHMKSTCPVLEGLQAVYRQREGGREAGREKRSEWL